MNNRFGNRQADRSEDARKSIPHGVYIAPNNPTIVYVTVCSKNRSPWLATQECHALLVSVWKDATAWVVGRYVMMPDHVHLFATIGQPELPLDNWVRYFKSQFTKRLRNPDCQWQTDHWDTRIRTAEMYEEKSWYVYQNPVRKSLVTSPELWPYQGVLNEIRWDVA
jgi:putative transposase